MDIEIFGEKHRFRTKLESAKAKSILDQIQSEVAKAEAQLNPGASEEKKIIVLTAVALNLANENFELKSQNSKMKNEVQKRLGDIISILDSVSKSTDQEKEPL